MKSNWILVVHSKKGKDKDDSYLSGLYNQLVMLFFEAKQVCRGDNLTLRFIHTRNINIIPHEPAIPSMRVLGFWTIPILPQKKKKDFSVST